MDTKGLRPLLHCSLLQATNVIVLGMEATPGRGRLLECKATWDARTLVSGAGQVAACVRMRKGQSFEVFIGLIGLHLSEVEFLSDFLLGLIQFVHQPAVIFTSDSQTVRRETQWELGSEEALLASLPPRPLLVYQGQAFARKSL